MSKKRINFYPGLPPRLRPFTDLDIVCGVDEAGRGPLAGPVFAAAVILDPKRPIEGLRDSKKHGLPNRTSYPSPTHGRGS